MKFFVGILLILVTMMLTLASSTVSQEDKDAMNKQNVILRTIIEAPTRTTARPCPEDQRQDSRGTCRTPL